VLQEVDYLGEFCSSGDFAERHIRQPKIIALVKKPV
jgi:hypothetical protein